jgi:hypothetical protein
MVFVEHGQTPIEHVRHGIGESDNDLERTRDRAHELKQLLHGVRAATIDFGLSGLMQRDRDNQPVCISLSMRGVHPISEAGAVRVSQSVPWVEGATQPG